MSQEEEITISGIEGMPPQVVRFVRFKAGPLVREIPLKVVSNSNPSFDPVAQKLRDTPITENLEANSMKVEPLSYIDLQDKCRVFELMLEAVVQENRRLEALVRKLGGDPTK